jgi:methionyl-tRNA formyltransferase
MRVVFVTHNELGLACLEELVDLGADVQGIFTRPQEDDLSDQIEIAPFAERNDVNLHRVSSVNNGTVKSQISKYEPDLLFVIGWSQLVDTDILNIPSVAALGMHPAPLPRGRGRAPLAWSIIKGLDETALSMFHLVEEADAGDLVGQEALPIDREDDASSLYEKMVVAGRMLIQDYYPKFESGFVPRKPQDDSKATWWPKRLPKHGLIDWNRSPWDVYNWIRGQTRPYPGAYSYIDGEKVTIWAADPPTNETVLVRPGEISYCKDNVLGVGVWEGILELTEIQVGQDDPISAGELVSEYEIEVGDMFVGARDRIGVNK